MYGRGRVRWYALDKTEHVHDKHGEEWREGVRPSMYVI